MKARVVRSHPELTRMKLGDDSQSDAETMMPGYEDKSVMAGIISRWDSLLVVLVGVMLIMLLLSAPLTIIMGYRRQR